jgi:hypothetical protein
VELLSRLHEVAGKANSSQHPNTAFIDIRYDTVLEALLDMEEGTELFAKYDLE